MVEWSDQVEAASWWIDRLHPFSDHVVGSLIPVEFSAVCRVFHPLDDDSGEWQRWSDLAAANGRTAHAGMDLARIASRAGDHQTRSGLPWALRGGLPAPERQALTSILASVTAAEHVWYGFTTIDSTFTTPQTAAVRSVGTPDRRYYLIRGTLATIEDVCAYANDWPTDKVDLLAGPTLWWPHDQSWFVASDVDMASTYVAGTAELIERIESSPALEALRTGFDHTGADIVNPP